MHHNMVIYHISITLLLYSRVVKLKKLLKKTQYKLTTVANLMKDRKVFLSTALYGLLGFAVIIFNEVILPV